MDARSADIKYAYNGQKVVLFDITRSQPERFNYEVLESIKNGMIFSGKYESAVRIFADVPHVVVFSNWGPEDKIHLSRELFQQE